MKAQFKFKPGDRVTARNGFTAPVAICGITSEGNQYLLRNEYVEQWTAEKDLKSADGKEPIETE